MRFLTLIGLFLLTACSEKRTVTPGRGAESEVGPVADVYPSGESVREERHGLWRGVTDERVVWEVRYTRGNPTGPYREWNPLGELIATWPYNWDGEIDGWVRFFEKGEPVYKMEVTPDLAPEEDPIGMAVYFLQWIREQQTSATDPAQL